MKRILALLIMAMLVMTLGTAGVFAAEGDQQVEQGTDVDDEQVVDIEGQQDVAEEEEVEEEESDTDEEADESKGKGQGIGKGLIKALDKTKEKLADKQEKIQEKLADFEEKGHPALEEIKAEFGRQLEELNTRLEEKIQVMEGKLLAKGTEIGFDDAVPVIKSGRTLIPVRAVTETLGASVEWDQEANAVTIIKGETTLVIMLGTYEYTVNGEAKAFDVPAQLISNRTFVPLRYIAEELGMDVNYDSETGDVDLEELTEEEQTETSTDEDLASDSDEETFTDVVY